MFQRWQWIVMAALVTTLPLAAGTARAAERLRRAASSTGDDLRADRDRRLFRRAGADVETNRRHDARDLGFWDTGARKTIHFNAHYDVVPVSGSWRHGSPFNPVVEKGWIYGRGTGDMKGATQKW